MGPVDAFGPTAARGVGTDVDQVSKWKLTRWMMSKERKEAEEGGGGEAEDGEEEVDATGVTSMLLRSCA